MSFRFETIDLLIKKRECKSMFCFLVSLFKKDMKGKRGEVSLYKYIFICMYNVKDNVVNVTAVHDYLNVMDDDALYCMSELKYHSKLHT